ncbi:MAG: hypothetical protein DMG57_14235 [Acidobacteria bacterium]|nr:MAG: hypothetical protein DMG57_14235 [Acidobacteriota bacterium]
MSNTPGPPTPKKEPTMETRLLLAFALMGLVLFATPYFIKTISPPQPVKKSAVQKAPEKPPTSAPEPSQATNPTLQPSPPAEAHSAGRIAAQKEEEFTIDTDVYRVVLSNQDAIVRHWILKKYTDDNGKPLELVNIAGTAKAGYPFQFYFEDRKPAVDVNAALYSAKRGEDGLSITYEFSDGAVTARKTFRFQKDRYLSEVSSAVTENGTPVPHLLAWRAGFGDPSILTSGTQHIVFFDLTDSKLVTRDAKSAKNGPVNSEGNYSFAGIEDSYFAAVFIPTAPGPVKIVTLSDTVPSANNSKEEPHVGSAVGGAGVNHYALFVGPKDLDVLNHINPQLTRLVDYGWFTFLAKPLFLALHYVNDKWTHNYGWAIIIVTILINFLLFPLKLTNLKSMRKMQVVQPEVKAIQDKYKGLSMRDPRRQQQNEEIMALYKKHGANPMGGCFPMLVQIPFFIAFYKVLAVSIELRHAHWLWVSDLASAEHIPIRILPIAMIATQFFLQKMTPTTTVDPNQQRMMLIMPLVMGFIFYGLPSGLVLYYLTANLVGMAQQVFFNKTSTPAESPQPAAVGNKKQITRIRR